MTAPYLRAATDDYAPTAGPYMESKPRSWHEGTISAWRGPLAAVVHPVSPNYVRTAHGGGGHRLSGDQLVRQADRSPKLVPLPHISDEHAITGDVADRVRDIRQPMPMELRWMTPADADTVAASSHLFDHELRSEWVRRFLAHPDHYLCIAYASGEPAGFVSGVELTHPDKGTEMFLYELAVVNRFRRRGIGKALVAALADLARGRGCYGMWVLTDSNNSAAVMTYKSVGVPSDQGESLMLSWRFDDAHQPSTDSTA